MADLHRVGLIVNPRAGRGGAVNLGYARAAVDRLGCREVITGPGELGALALQRWRGALRVCDVPDGAGRAQTQLLARCLLAHDLDALIVVGGDGTLADVAVLDETAGGPPLLGIGAGSTNVGRLITVPGEAVPSLDPDRLSAHAFDGVCVTCNGELLGLGFNDAVIGTTIIGTVDGRARDLSAEARLRGQTRPMTPAGIGRPTTRVTRVGPAGAMPVAQGTSVGTVIVGFAEPTFFGKAVAGGVCLTACTGLPAGCLVCDQPLVQVDLDAAAVLARPASVSRYVSLDASTSVVVESVETGAVLCVDGNPLRALTPTDAVALGIRRAAATAFRVLPRGTTG
jgi:hypothetical protein